LGEELVVGGEDTDSESGGKSGFAGRSYFDGEDGGFVLKREAGGGFVDPHGRGWRGLRRDCVEREGGG